MGKFDDDRQKFLPIFWSNITERQRQDYELAKKHFGPLYRVQDTNYFMKKFKEYQTNPSSFVILIKESDKVLELKEAAKTEPKEAAKTEPKDSDKTESKEAAKTEPKTEGR
jgi:hypothetical protein